MLLTNCHNKSNNTTEVIYKSSIIIEFYNIEFYSKKKLYEWSIFVRVFFVQANPLCLYISLSESSYISPYHLLLLLTKTELFFHNLSLFFNTNHTGFALFSASVLSIHEIMQFYEHWVYECQKVAS